jgi:hypothetical protein
VTFYLDIARGRARGRGCEVSTASKEQRQNVEGEFWLPLLMRFQTTGQSQARPGRAAAMSRRRATREAAAAKRAMEAMMMML